MKWQLNYIIEHRNVPILPDTISSNGFIQGVGMRVAWDF